MKYFFKIISTLEINEDFKLSIQYKLLSLFTKYIIPNAYFKLNQINQYLEKLLKNTKLMKLNPSHPLFYWIDSIIISGCEGSCKIAIEDLLDILVKFIDIILQDEFLNNLSFVKISMKTYQFVNNLNKILSRLKKDFGIIQLKYLHCIPPLLDQEINTLLNQYLIIHQDYNNRNPLYSFIKEKLSDKKISPKLLEACIISSDLIIKSTQIVYKEKEEILKFCREFSKKYQNSNDLPNVILSLSSISENICSKFGLNIYKNTFLKLIKNSEQKRKLKTPLEYKNVFNAFLQARNLEEFNKICSIFNSLSISEFFYQIQSIKNQAQGRNLNELLPAFQKEKFPLSSDELNQLKQFVNEFEKEREYIQTEFIEEGRNFKQNPTIQNLAKLIKIVNCGIFESLKIHPYLIQNLIVFSFYLHYINKQKRENFKGRLGQILTGEGKSLIISEIALISALMGDFVDIITSTTYLASRDQQYFKELYNLFGISSNVITEKNPSKESYNGIILYGTNTDFEFTLLREGINLEKKMFTVPLGKKVEIRREFQTVIVDESDNLFIDTALNSARIAYQTRNHYNWVYFPILNCVKNNNTNINVIRNKLEIINPAEANKISDNQIQSWIKMANTALEFKKDEKYVVRYNEETQRKEIQIIQLSTGRVSVGSRWQGGLHEFIEVKERLEPETESNTIASISHPSFFRKYKTIFGLTGTIGSNIEREEILDLYGLDSFDIPPNFASQRIIYPPILLENKFEKEEKIINEILKIRRKGRPILVLLLTIEETINFSNRLKKEGINNLVLNDVQKEKEDFIILYAGKPGNVVVATNAAGRGTDIILSEESLNLGGLHVIIGFYPENNRVECQGIGRAGRHGQAGSAQILFSKDEYFFNQSIIYSIEDAESLRNKKLINDSKIRIVSSKYEINIYEILEQFFNKLLSLKEIIESDEFKIFFKKLEKNNFDYNIFCKKIIENFKADWAEYFNEISKRNFIIVIPSFDLFLEKYGWKEIDNQNRWSEMINHIKN